MRNANRAATYFSIMEGSRQENSGNLFRSYFSELRTQDRPYSLAAGSSKWIHEDIVVKTFLEKEHGILAVATRTEKTITAMKIINNYVEIENIETLLSEDGVKTLNAYALKGYRLITDYRLFDKPTSREEFLDAFNMAMQYYEKKDA